MPHTQTAPSVIVRRYMKCAFCALWLPVREDSIAGDTGICPRKIAPHNRTQAVDGCHDGVEPKE